MPASDALVRGVQAEIRSSFDRLQHAEPMRRIQESSNLLLPEEICYLRNQGVLPQPTEKDAASVACRKLIKRWEAPHAYDLTCSPHDRDKDHCYCWPGFKDPSGQPHIRRPTPCTWIYPLAARPTLFSYLPSVTVAPSASHLRGVLGLDAGDTELVLIGDSLGHELELSAKCEAKRAGLNESRIHFVRLGHRNQARQLVEIQKSLARWPLDARVVTAVSIGAHYNQGREKPDWRQQTGLALNYTQKEFVTDVQGVLGALDKHAAKCKRCATVFLTSQSQHFDHANGEWDSRDEWIRGANGEWGQNMDREGLVLVPANESAKQQKYFGCKPWRGPPSAESPNYWRSAEVFSRIEQFPHVIAVPLGALSSNWWDAHQGLYLDNRCKPMGGGACMLRTIPWVQPEPRKMTPDCTHYCHSPFLYQAVWWALSRAASTIG